PVIHRMDRYAPSPHSWNETNAPVPSLLPSQGGWRDYRASRPLFTLFGDDGANLLVFPGELPADQRDRDGAGGRDLLDPALGGEGVAELVGPLAHQVLELNLAGDVARAVARLAQVELLLEAEEVEVGAHPAARGPLDLEGLGLREVELVGLEVERGE